MTAMKTATLLLIAAVAFAGVAHGEQPEDALDANVGRELLNCEGPNCWPQQQPQQPRNKNANKVKVVNPTFQNAQSGDGGKGGNGGISLLDGNSIAIAIIPIGGGGAQSGNTNGQYANGGNGGDSGPAVNSNQNNVGVLGVAGRKLLNMWNNPQPQPSRNTNGVKIINLTGQSATTGNGGDGGKGGVSVADANSIAVALLPFLGGAQSGNTGGKFSNGGNGGDSGPATNWNQNNVGVASGAGRKLLTGSDQTGSQAQPSRNTNRIKVIDLTRQSAMSGNGGDGGNGGVSAADANSIAVALLPFLGVGGAKSGNTGGSFANGGNGGDSGPAANWNSNNVGVASFAGGRKLLHNSGGQTDHQPQQGTNANRIKVINLTGQSAMTGKGGDGGNGGFSALNGNSIALAIIPLGGGAQSGNTNGQYANGGNGGDSGPALNSNKNNVGIIGGGK